MDSTPLTRAQGCLLGQLVGDSLGSLVEFSSTHEIRRRYPDGVRDLANGGPFNLVAGQPTDDSEMALALARCLLANGEFDAVDVQQAYVDWLASSPFDVGLTVRAGLNDRPNHYSQANGAMMRQSPLGIFSTRVSEQEAAAYAKADTLLTHPNLVCVSASVLYVLAIRQTILEGLNGQQLYEYMLDVCAQFSLQPIIRTTVEQGYTNRPSDYTTQAGWVLIALQNAVYQLIHAPNFEEALVDTIWHGGDTDTNAAIAGGLLGAVHGLDQIPVRWRVTIESCRPERGKPQVRNPRPEIYWPVDFMSLSASLLPQA